MKNSGTVKENQKGETGQELKGYSCERIKTDRTKNKYRDRGGSREDIKEKNCERIMEELKERMRKQKQNKKKASCRTNRRKQNEAV